MPRLMLNNEHWSKLKPILLQQGIYLKPDLRMTVEGILYRRRSGCSWRDLPEVFGRWNTVYKRFNAWSAAGKLTAIFNALVDDPDVERLFIDGTYTKAHQHSAGAASDEAEAIGKSRAGNTSKIHLAVDACGLPIACRLTGGEVHDSKEAPALIAELPSSEALVADKGYDSDTLRQQINVQEMRPVIPRKRTQEKDMPAWIEGYIAIGTWSRMSLHE